MEACLKFGLRAECRQTRRMNFEDYKSHGKKTYLELAATVKMLLEQALDIEGGYRLQHIQFRAKS